MVERQTSKKHVILHQGAQGKCRRKQRKKESRNVSYERTLTKNSVKLKGKSVDSCLRLNEARQCTKDVPVGVQQFQGGFKYFNSNHQCDLIWHVFEDSFGR